MNNTGAEYKQKILNILKFHPYRASELAHILEISSYRVGALCSQLKDEKKINVILDTDSRGREIRKYELPAGGQTGGRTKYAYITDENLPQPNTGAAMVRAIIEVYCKAHPNTTN